MNTAREFSTFLVSSAPAVRVSLWVRTAEAINAVWNRLASTAPIIQGAEIRMTCTPVNAKIPAISIAGKHIRPARKGLSPMVPSLSVKPQCRPGVQGRWKSSDRVATL